MKNIIGYCFTPNEVFEGRNKEYGAFRLRKVYQKRLLAALAVGSACFSLGLTAPVIYASLDTNPNDDLDFNRVVELKNIEAPPLDPEQPPPPPIEAPPPPPPKVETVRFVPPEVAPDEEVPEEELPPPQEELKEVQASTITQEGDPDVDPDEVIVEDPVNEQAEVVGTGTAEQEVFVIVEQMPEFPGGQKALMQFLAGEIEYPEIAKKAGVEGRVFVQFVVRPDGSIEEVAVVRGIGAGCDEEAIRAVKAMPKWIPGKQRGEPVSVRYSMPIVFKLR